jgi:D-galactarolactone cycloisomerase
VTGLREKTADGRQHEAATWAEQGIGIKPCLGLGYLSDSREVERLRAAIGDEATLLVDGMWNYTYPEALRVGRAYEKLGVGFLEAPLIPEDIHGHARLSDKLDLPIAIGEPLRTRHAFLPWFEQRALSVAQPDQMRNGVTETVNIARLAESFNLPVALHTGCVTVVGMSATWQIASTLPNFMIQEYQPVMLDTFNPWLADPLRVVDGALSVPRGPGLGLSLDEERIVAQSTSSVTIDL